MWPPARMALNLVAHKPAGAVTFPNAIFPSDLARSRGVSRAAFWDTLALTLRGFMEGVVDVRAVCKPGHATPSVAWLSRSTRCVLVQARFWGAVPTRATARTSYSSKPISSLVNN
jgi:hypothetical protein